MFSRRTLPESRFSPLSAPGRPEEHYRSCNCLADSAECCDPSCCPPAAPEPEPS